LDYSISSDKVGRIELAESSLPIQASSRKIDPVTGVMIKNDLVDFSTNSENFGICEKSIFQIR